jgi:hypothetical protein
MVAFEEAVARLEEKFMVRGEGLMGLG